MSGVSIGSEPILTFLISLICSAVRCANALQHGRFDPGNVHRCREDTLLTYVCCVPILPILQEQAAIARILDAVDNAIGCTHDAVERARVAKRALVQKVFSEGLLGEQQTKTVIGHIPKSWQVVPVNSVVKTFQYGLSVPMEDSGHMPILRMGKSTRRRGGVF